MASPDTDELATVPLPAGQPGAEQVPSRRAAPETRDEAGEVRQEGPETAPREAAGRSRTASQPEARGAADEPTVEQERVVTQPERLGAADEPTAGQERTVARPGALGAAEELAVEQERAAPERIDPAEGAPSVEASASPGPVKARGRWWRGFTGSLAAGLTVLALGVLAVAGICLFTGAPGPGATLLVGHPMAAALALLAQRVADRRNGPPAVGAGLAVVLFTVSALTLFWLT
ncbi:hypothetical protein [Amycolatopsis sp. DG1A-15b]|uniref:hypothetical protein n=1 Tax=Amycolatopsis sp. DG1A-15b TaxID=3052846 RepID=UPI00255BE995|nr:hypothetical protein [Amycolatopsis sp. DG1A-15b]WIX87890.1 hypothetical protein QRY02_43275 [Amycolatopsis sp. DG1A-15b]